MASAKRLVEVIFRLKDQFTKQAGKVTGAYKDITTSAALAESRVAKSSKRITRAFGSIGAKIGAVFTGGALTAGVVKLTQFVDEVEKLEKTARKLGTTTEELSKLGYAAEITGVQTETLHMGLQRMTRRIAEAATGAGEARGALKELGIDAQRLASLSVDEQFKAIADAMEGVTQQSDRVRLGFKLFDSSGVALINTLEGGSEALERYGDQLEEIGGVITSQSAKAAAELKDNMAVLGANMDAIANEYGPAVIGTLNVIFRNMGIGVRTIQSVKQEIFELNEELKDLDSISLVGTLFGKGQDERLARIAEINKKLQELGRERVKFLNAPEEKRAREEAFEAQKEAAKKSDDLAKKQTENLKTELAARRQAVRDHTREMAAARKETADIQKEFDELVKGPQEALQKDPADLNLLDLSKPIADAQRAFAEGDFDGAVDSARAAGEMLASMREEGTYADIVLTGMAQKIRDLAVEAQAAQEPKLIEVKLDEQALARVEERLELLKQGITIPIVTAVPTYPQDLSKEAEKRGAKI